VGLAVLAVLVELVALVVYQGLAAIQALQAHKVNHQVSLNMTHKLLLQVVSLLMVIFYGTMLLKLALLKLTSVILLAIIMTLIFSCLVYFQLKNLLFKIELQVEIISIGEFQVQ
jgi:hypothetical protein